MQSIEVRTDRGVLETDDMVDSAAGLPNRRAGSMETLATKIPRRSKLCSLLDSGAEEKVVVTDHLENSGADLWLLPLSSHREPMPIAGMHPVPVPPLLVELLVGVVFGAVDRPSVTSPNNLEVTVLKLADNRSHVGTWLEEKLYHPWSHYGDSQHRSIDLHLACGLPPFPLDS